MTVRGHRRVKPLVHKAQVRLRIIGRFGVPFFIYKYRKRWHYAAGVGAFLLVLYVMSLFIWDIQFDGNYRYTYDTLIRYLDPQDTDYGTLKFKINCEDLESSVRISFPEVTWVSARVSGTRLLIHIKENEVLFIVPEKDETPCDIVASQAGTITSMVVRQGIAQVFVGGEVEEEQVLVSGCVPIISDSEEEINAYMVHADTDVVARTTREYERTIPLLHKERVQTDHKHQGWYVKAGKWSFTFLMLVRGQGEWDYAMEEQQLKLFSDFYLPLYIGDIKGREMSAYERNYAREELEHISKAINYQFVKNLEEKGVQILESNDRIETSISQYRIKGELVTQESIVKTQPAAERMEEPGSEPEETRQAQMGVIEMMISIPAEHKKNVCRQFDTYLKKIERTLHVTMIARDGKIKIIRPEQTIGQVENVFNNLIELSGRGNTITEQSVDYALSLPFTEKDGQILEIDKDITYRTIMGKPVKPKILGQKNYVDSTRKKMIVFDVGPAGTGKTYLVMVMAIQAFKNGEVGRIILTRPTIEAGEKLGFLPGDLQSKIDPYLRPLYDTLYQIMGMEAYLHNLEKGLIKVVPLACMRGRTLDNAYIILDETQSTTPAQMKMFLTRIGFGSKVIVTGGRIQKDLPSGAVSGLDTALKVLKKIDDIGLCYLTSSDVVRHPLVQKIVQAYDTYGQKNEQRSK